MNSNRLPPIGRADAEVNGQDDQMPTTSQNSIRTQKISAKLMAQPLHK